MRDTDLRRAVVAAISRSPTCGSNAARGVILEIRNNATPLMQGNPIRTTFQCSAPFFALSMI